MPGGDAIDTVVLACTHFPLIIDDLAVAFGPGVRFVDGAGGIARRIAFLTKGQDFVRTAPDLALFTRDDPGLKALTPALCALGLERMAVF
jgi:glutamate racemase